MVITKKYLTIVAVLLAFITLHAQKDKHAVRTNPAISQKKNELSKVRQEISSLEKELKLKAAKEKESYNTLDNYNRQSYLLHNLINNLKADESEKEQQISDTQNNIEELKNEISLLKMNYSKYVVAIYKHGKPDYWASVLDANSFEQAILRYKYLKKFSDQRERDLERLQNKQEEETKSRSLQCRSPMKRRCLMQSGPNERKYLIQLKMIKWR
jgi:septal ring factor EnvC (AmiA/AmiB activator)